MTAIFFTRRHAQKNSGKWKIEAGAERHGMALGLSPSSSSSSSPQDPAHGAIIRRSASLSVASNERAQIQWLALWRHDGATVAWLQSYADTRVVGFPVQKRIAF